ncbi:MAG: endonuclease, partial [Bacteroidales bacterium]|nr:endonuclease [Bacteroidales bacterium]
MKNNIAFVSSIFMLCFAFACSQNLPYHINIATYNLRMDTPHDSLDSWEYRKENVNGLIRFHDFDIMGTQEGFY